MREDSGGGFSAGSIFLAFILGSIVGAGFALLMSPQSGKETRDKIKGLAEDVKKKASEYAEEVKDKLSTAAQQGKDFIEEKKSLLTTAVEAGKEAYEREKEKHSKTSS
jgi:gas vesicle protein